MFHIKAFVIVHILLSFAEIDFVDLEFRSTNASTTTIYPGRGFGFYTVRRRRCIVRERSVRNRPSVLHSRLTLLWLDTEYIDRLELKSATDRTLGVGVLGSEGELLILTAATTMKVYVDMDQISKFDPEYVFASQSS